MKYVQLNRYLCEVPCMGCRYREQLLYRRHCHTMHFDLKIIRKFANVFENHTTCVFAAITETCGAVAFFANMSLIYMSVFGSQDESKI